MSVVWKPFCGNDACDCMEPAVGGPCEEFMEVDYNPRCARCGWPPRRHRTRYGRAPSVFGDDRFVYYRQRPGRPLERWRGTGWRPDVPYNTWEKRAASSTATRLEEFTDVGLLPYMAQAAEEAQ